MRAAVLRTLICGRPGHDVAVGDQNMIGDGDAAALVIAVRSASSIA